MNISEIIITIISLIMLVPTIASMTKFDQWWVRGFDFPRIQISVLTVIVLIFAIITYSFDVVWHLIILGLLLTSFFYQTIKILPYTIFSKKQVLAYQKKNSVGTISILVSNVLKTNRNSEKLISHVYKNQPDLLLTLETDCYWENELKELEIDYPFTVKIPKDNFYGMHLFSKLQLEEIEVKYIIESDIPSIHGYVRLENGQKIKIHCLHPKPPSPTENDTSTNRDAELLLVGKEVKKDQESVLLFGDLNDVAWSRTTQLFQKLSGLMDPRIGRGFFNTFNVGYAFLRWPLDHVFHTNDFTLIELKRLKSIDSDHFPMFIKLNYEPRAENMQDEPEEANGDEKDWANEKIANGKPK